MNEIDSFLWKFSNLWRNGSNANLTFDTHAGQASVTLRLGLGEFVGFNQQQHQYFEQKKKRLSPSKLRRRERRAAAVAQSSSAAEEESVSSVEMVNNVTMSPENSGILSCGSNDDELKLDSKKCEASVDGSCLGAVKATENGICVSRSLDNSLGADKALGNGCGAAKASEDNSTSEDVTLDNFNDKDYNIYAYRYWSLKHNESDDVKKYFEEKLNASFEENKICDRHKLYHIYNLSKSCANEYELMVKIKKHVKGAEKSARSIQTGYSPDKEILVALKSIS